MNKKQWNIVLIIFLFICSVSGIIYGITGNDNFTIAPIGGICGMFFGHVSELFIVEKRKCMKPI